MADPPPVTGRRREPANGAVRIWIDMTAPAHPLVFRPIVQRLAAAGHDVRVTARDYAQTLELLDRMGIAHERFGTHGGASRVRKLTRLIGRTARSRGYARRQQFDLAVAHGSNDLALAAAALRIPAVNTFDYEWASQQHRVGCRLARRVVTPDAIPPERLARYGVTDTKLAQYPGLKEEYYLADFEPDPQVLEGAWCRPHAHGGGAAAATGRLALPPQVEPALPPGRGAPRAS